MERKPVLTFSAAVGPVQGNGVAVFMPILSSGRGRKETPRWSPEMGPAHRVCALPATIPNPTIGSPIWHCEGQTSHRSGTSLWKTSAIPFDCWGYGKLIKRWKGLGSLGTLFIGSSIGILPSGHGVWRVKCDRGHEPESEAASFSYSEGAGSPACSPVCR